MKAYHINAFTKNGKGGNPAGVVLDAGSLTDDQKQLIAKKLGFSETAFVEKSETADFKVRFFTPNGEVDLCGHATIGTFSLIYQLGLIKSGNYSQETKAGILCIEITENGTVFMNQNLPDFGEILSIQEIVDSLNIDPRAIEENLPIQIVSTGLRDIFVPMKSLRDLKAINPDFQKVAAISKKYNTIGYHLFTLETLFHTTAHCRNFAPLYNINEEAATGTSSGALACYLFHYGKITEEGAQNCLFEQGYVMNEPSEIQAQLRVENMNIQTVRVGGFGDNIQEISF